MVRSADSACLLAERSGYDLDLMAHRPPLKAVQLFMKRLKQSRTSLSYAAADDYDLRIESVDQRSDRGRQMENGTQPDSGCFFVAGEMRFDELARGSETTLGPFSNVIVADHLFETSGSVHDIRSAVRVH